MIDLVELYFKIDDFCRKFVTALDARFIGNEKPITVDTKGLSLSEILSILVYYHFSKIDCIKHYYLIKQSSGFKKYFPNLPYTIDL